jgi:hypothetical protein
VAKIKHTRNEIGQNFTHQNKTTLFWRKKAKINLHQNFPIYGVVELYHNILLALDNKEITSITFADVSKAFDRVWIRGFILKLERYGVRENYCVG